MEELKKEDLKIDLNVKIDVINLLSILDDNWRQNFEKFILSVENEKVVFKFIKE